MKTTILIAKRYGQADVLEFVENTLPDLPDTMARIAVKVAGINPIDARRMTGKFKHAALPQAFGTEFAGVITALPENASGWAVGDEVLGSGDSFTHATIIDVPLTNLVRRPANLDWAVAGSIAGVGQTAMTILDELGDIKSLLIHGASGGVGSVLVQLAYQKGIEVVATASEKNQDYLAELGAKPVVYGEGLVERLKAIHPEPFSAAMDMSGTEAAIQASLETVAPEGLIGSISGKSFSSPRVRPFWVKRNRANLQKLVQAVANGTLSWEASTTFPFTEAKAAYASVLKGHARGKTVLTFADAS